MVEYKRGYRKWDKQVDDVLAEMFDADCTLEEMVEVVQRPAPHIRTRLYMLGKRLSERGAEINMEAFHRIMKLRQGDKSDPDEPCVPGGPAPPDT